MIRRVDSLFSQWNNSGGPGCVIGIVRNDSLIFAKGYGMANLEYQVPNSPETIFHVASVSKQFTAFSILLLAKQGKLNLDDDIRKYLPWFPDLKSKITIRNLLNHTSGIRDQYQLLALAGTRVNDIITQEQIVKILSKQRGLNFKPGDEFNYANSGYTLLAEIVKSVSGQSLRRFTDSAIFNPLIMSKTFFHDDYSEIVKNRSYSYRLEEGNKYINRLFNCSSVGATSLFTNVNDMSKWIMNFYGHQVGDQHDIDMLTQKGKLNDGTELDYGCGIYSSIYNGYKKFSHGGSDAGYRTFVSVFPSLKMGFIVFCNVSSINPGDKADALADLFMNAPQKSSIKTREIGEFNSARSYNNIMAFKKYAGNYIGEDGHMLNFEIKDHSFYCNVDDENDLMVKKSNDTLHTLTFPERKFVFSFHGTDTTVMMVMTEGKQRLKKYSTPAKMTDQSLKAYTGSYYSPELDSRYDIILKNHTLYLTNSKYDDAPLTLIGSNELLCDYWWMSHLKILFDRFHHITGFEVNTGRVMHLIFNKIL